MKKYIVSGLLALTLLVPAFSFAQNSSNADVDPDPSSSGCVMLNYNMRYQMRDAQTNGEVSSLQDVLQAQGYLNSEPTGYFGLLTVAAVKGFQVAHGVQGTGYVGPLTRAQINAVSCGNASSAPTTSPIPVMCTMEAKMCPDGLYVGRSGPRCEFAQCSNSGTTNSNTDAQGCYPGRAFSTTTGQPCNIKLPAGCGTANGFSTTTGLSCGNPVSDTPAPTFTLGHVVYKDDGTAAMDYWTATNITSCNLFKVADYQFSIFTSDVNSPHPGGSFSIQTSGSYAVRCIGPGGAVSSDYFTVAIPSGNTNSNLPAGCSSSSGFSSTTGESCGQQDVTISNFTNAISGPNGPVRAGDLVDIFGSGFMPNENILIDNVGEGYYNALNYISSSHVTFTVPSGLSLGKHDIKIGVARIDGRGAMVSNGVVLTVVSSFDLRSGCSSASGYSSTTGEFCGTSNNSGSNNSGSGDGENSSGSGN